MKDGITILYESADHLVINKPVSIMVHPDGRSDEKTISDWVGDNYPETLEVGEPLVLESGESILRPGIVHRLDKDTSGVLVICRTKEAFLDLKKQFQEQRVRKIYNAFVYGRVKNDQGKIDRPIGRSPGDFRRWSAQRGARGKMREAVTLYKVLQRGSESSYLEVGLETGRTHQIRVHLKAINYPVICDKLYAPNREPLLGFKRLALHASSISFMDRTGTSIKVEAPLPDDFQKALELIGE
jgi:23S rRNA pseudouridine1911/1915/1917 synthase